MNNCIELMIDEHRYIKRMLAVMRKLCIKILNGENVRYENFYDVVDFVRNYADKHHHGKEELILFTAMLENLGPAAEKLIRYGMAIEHDLGRLYIQDLEDALGRVMEGNAEAKLDIIANAVSYTYLLGRHIDKEDGVVYKYAQNNLPKDVMCRVEEECSKFEQKAESDNVRERYIALLEELESRAQG